MGNGMRMRATIVSAVAVALVAALAGPAPGAAQVTRGEFAAFATAAPGGINADAYADIAGHAQMVRTADGKTVVTVHITGLNADTSYPVHVHAAACESAEADGHFKNDPAGAPNPPNEIWPLVSTDDAGVGNGKDTASWSAGAGAVSVVIHAPTALPNKIGCANLA